VTVEDDKGDFFLFSARGMSRPKRDRSNLSFSQSAASLFLKKMFNLERSPRACLKKKIKLIGRQSDCEDVHKLKGNSQIDDSQI